MATYLTLRFYSGRLGNQLIQYGVIVSMAEKYGFKYVLPELNIGGKILPVPYTNMLENDKIPNTKVKVTFGQTFDVNRLKGNKLYMLDGYFQKYQYLSNNVRNILREGFRKIKPLKKEDECVVHIRAGDQWLYNREVYQGKKICLQNQPILPINYYKMLLKDEKLPIKFLGESLKDPYIKILQNEFPNATFQSENIMDDFITILCAKKYVMSVSTFSWCGAWITNNANKIIFPLHGFYHPNEQKKKDSGEYIMKDRKEIEYYDFNWQYGTIWMGDDKDYNEAINYDISKIKKIKI